jgi:hypothetical protein
MLHLADMTGRQFIGDPIVMPGHSQPLATLRGDGKAVAFADDRGVVVWHLDPEHIVAAACPVRLAEPHAPRNGPPTSVASGPYQRLCPGEPPG